MMGSEKTKVRFKVYKKDVQFLVAGFGLGNRYFFIFSKSD